MRYICLYSPDPSKPPGPPSPELMAAMGKLIEQETKAGILVATEGFDPSPKDVRVRLSRAEFSITDGPFTETKEVIGGFAVLECKSREEAIEATKRFLKVAGGGMTEIHEPCHPSALPIEQGHPR